MDFQYALSRKFKVQPKLVLVKVFFFISGHANPGSPYVFGLVEDDHDLEFPEPMPVIGLSRSAMGYCIVSVLETMKTYSLEDGLTEEAVVTKLRTFHYHHLFFHKSLKNNFSGTTRWTEFGEGGLLWGECNGIQSEWIEGNVVDEILFKHPRDPGSFRLISLRSSSPVVFSGQVLFQLKGYLIC